MTLPTRKNTWIVPKDYTTPARSYPLGRVGRARLDRRPYKPGLYDMHGVRGARYCRLTQKLPVTCLEIGGRTWMVDDVLHWEAVQELAARFRPGTALIGGLGLGLILHALHQTRPDVTPIVVEREPDVIALMRPLVPDVEILEADAWDVLMATAPDQYANLFIDLWVGDGPTLWREEVAEAFTALDAGFPDAELFLFGFQAHVDLVRRARRAAGELMAKLANDPKAKAWMEAQV